MGENVVEFALNLLVFLKQQSTQSPPVVILAVLVHPGPVAHFPSSLLITLTDSATRTHSLNFRSPQ